MKIEEYGRRGGIEYIGIGRSWMWGIRSFLLGVLRVRRW